MVEASIANFTLSPLLVFFHYKERAPVGCTLEDKCMSINSIVGIKKVKMTNQALYLKNLFTISI